MILIDNKFSIRFIEKYKKEIMDLLDQNLYPNYLKENTVPVKFKTFYSKHIDDIIIGTPDKLKAIADSLFSTFPIMAETWQPKTFYRGYPSSIRRIVSQMARLNLTKKDARNKFILLSDKLHPVLVDYSTKKKSHYLPDLLLIINTSISLREKRDIYNTIYSLVRGLATVSSTIPDWVKNLSTLFDYNKIKTELLFNLCNNINITVCPLCNESNIEVILQGKHRPALDHFFAKSRHPLFAMSLYNLVPCCHTCNSTFKRDFETWSPLHANPYMQGVGTSPLFQLRALTVHSLYRAGKIKNAANYKIKIIPQGNEIDNNMRLLKTELVYNRSVAQQKLSHLLKIIGQYEKGMFSTHSMDSVLELLDYEDGRSALSDPYRKLKYDTINALLPEFEVKF